MRYMHWSYADLCEAPADLVDRVLELLIMQGQGQGQGTGYGARDNVIEVP